MFLHIIELNRLTLMSFLSSWIRLVCVRWELSDNNCVSFVWPGHTFLPFLPRLTWWHRVNSRYTLRVPVQSHSSGRKMQYKGRDCIAVLLNWVGDMIKCKINRLKQTRQMVCEGQEVNSGFFLFQFSYVSWILQCFSLSSLHTTSTLALYGEREKKEILLI